VLDVGCSNGEFGEALQIHKQCIADGIEPDRGDANLARKKLRNVYEGFLEDVIEKGLKGKKYDYVVFLDVIEHLLSPAESIRSLKKILKPGGKVIFSIPNMAHASTRIMLLGGNFEYGDTGLLDNTHLHFYTKNEIGRVFKEAGFKVTSWDFTEAVFTPEVLRQELAKVGLVKPTAELINLLSNDDAKIFQYIGAAEVGEETDVKRPHYSPNPQQAIISWFEQRELDLLKEIKKQGNELGKFQKILDIKEEQISELQSILSDQQKLASQISAKKYAKYLIKRKLKRGK
jgi:2-polyprenyl-3-methyl-5-hydroxy-6-metoxy-1,4-benzoquinol methylase